MSVDFNLLPLILFSLCGVGGALALGCLVLGFSRLPPPPSAQQQQLLPPPEPAPVPARTQNPAVSAALSRAAEFGLRPTSPAPAAPPPPATPLPTPHAPLPPPSAVRPAVRPEPARPPADWFSGLRKTRDALLGRLDVLLRGADRLDAALLEEIEAVLFSADLGTRTAEELMEVARRAGSAQEMRSRLRDHALELLQIAERAPVAMQSRPHVVLVVGVNGSGKTTTIGKLADRYQRQGLRVLVAAADTYRAAAIEQLAVWAQRAEVEIVKGTPGADPAAVAFDAVQAARSRAIDVVLIDTAGRLQTDAGLMDQLRKMARVVKKEVPDAPHEVLLVLDANTGQNAIRQAQQFKAAVDVSGIALTKLDGTAKGGVVLGIAQELALPVRYVGIGEGIADLADFDAERFVDALFARSGAPAPEPPSPPRIVH